MWQGSFISFLGVSYLQFSETVQDHDNLDESQLSFVKRDTESQLSCPIEFQASPVTSLFVDHFLAGQCSPEQMPLADQCTMEFFPLKGRTKITLKK